MQEALARIGPLGMPVRFWVVTTLAVVAAMLLMVGLFGDDLARARQACTDRGGEVVIESDPQSIGQYCVLPNGDKEPLAAGVR
jgi:hypothetical protein